MSAAADDAEMILPRAGKLQLDVQIYAFDLSDGCLASLDEVGETI